MKIWNTPEVKELDVEETQVGSFRSYAETDNVPETFPAELCSMRQHQDMPDEIIERGELPVMQIFPCGLAS